MEHGIAINIEWIISCRFNVKINKFSIFNSQSDTRKVDAIKIDTKT